MDYCIHCKSLFPKNFQLHKQMILEGTVKRDDSNNFIKFDSENDQELFDYIISFQTTLYPITWFSINHVVGKKRTYNIKIGYNNFQIVVDQEGKEVELCFTYLLNDVPHGKCTIQKKKNIFIF